MAFHYQSGGPDVVQPMAILMVGGMAVQLIAFLLAPCLYALAMERKLLRKPPDAPLLEGRGEQPGGL